MMLRVNPSLVRVWCGPELAWAVLRSEMDPATCTRRAILQNDTLDGLFAVGDEVEIEASGEHDAAGWPIFRIATGDRYHP
jgi:hypothetical protein